MKVGLCLPQRAEGGEGISWAQLSGLARFAEEGGADSLWLADHYLYRDESVEIGLHEAFTMLTAIAAVTTRVQVGPLVAATSFRSAGMLAKIAATLDAVSGGRLILGLGCGWHEAEYQAFGIPFDHRVGRFEEVVQAVRSLLHGERVTAAGRWMELDDAVILPPPEHQVPIVIASEGPRMMSLTARYADGWQCGWSGMPDEGFQGEWAAVRAACAAADRPDRLALFKGVDVTDEESEAPHIPIDATAIADALGAWEEQGVDHLQLRAHPGTHASFEVALAGIARYRG